MKLHLVVSKDIGSTSMGHRRRRRLVRLIVTFAIIPLITTPLWADPNYGDIDPDDRDCSYSGDCDSGGGGSEGGGSEGGGSEGGDEPPPPTKEELRRGDPPAEPTKPETPPADASAPEGAEIAGDPVYPYTGDFIAHYTDIKIPGPGYPFTLERVYTTKLEGGGDLGPKWRHSFERRLTMKWDYALEVTNGEGWKSVYMFEANPHIPVDGFGGDPLIDTDLSAGTWAGSELNTNTIVRNPDGTFTERTKEGVEYTYAGYRARWKENEATAGRLLSIVDRTGHGLSFNYDGEGRIARIEDAVGRNYTFEYTGDKLVRVGAPLGMDVRYVYDGLGRLQRVVGLKDELREYFYDQEGRIDRLVAPSGQVYQYAYDGEDRLVTVHVDGRQYNRFTYDFSPNERRTVFTDPRGTDWQYVYDELGRLTSKGIVGRPPVRYEYTDPDNRYNRTAVIDETGRRWTFVYDERKNVVRSTGPDQVSRRYEWGEEYNQLRRVQIDGISGAWVYTYDERGNLTAAADPDGRTSRYSGHGPLGLPHTVANGEGETTSLGYDQWGNLSVIESPATGRTVMTYDAAGRLIAVKPTGERTTTYDWSPNSREVVVTDSAGKSHLYRWDAAGHLVYYDQPGSGAHSWIYNPLGHLEFYTDATGAHYEWTVNLAGDVTAYNPPEAGVWEYTYHPTGQIRTETIPGRGSREYVYDPAGRIQRVAGPEGTTSYHYDNAGRLDRVEEPGGIVSEYLEYDPRGFVRRMTGPENRVFQWNYNGSGLLASMVDAERRVEYVYDRAGRVKEKRDSVAGTVVYRRNSRGLLESVVYPDETVRFAYDAAGRLTVADDPDMRERFAYNEAGRLSAVTYEDIGKRILYGYDDLGNLATMTTPEGDVVTYERDPAGRTERFSAPHGIGAVLDWDDRGRMTRLDYANGTAAHLTYDPDNLLKNYSWNGPTGTLLDRSFSYYPDQRLKEMREAQYRWNYDYDEAGRLDDASYPSELTGNIRSWQDGQFPPGHAVGYGAIYTGVPETTVPGQGGPNGQGPPGLGEPGGEAWDSELTFPPLVEHETWDYDDAANIEGRTRDGSWDQFTYEGLNRLVAAGSIEYEYTRAGEVREKRTPDGTTTLSWNSRGELIEARTADGVTVRYGYDAFGRMVRRTATPADGEIPPTAEKSAYLWHERTLLAEYDVSEGGEANPYKEYFHVAGRLIAVKMHGFHGRREPGPEGFLHTKGGVMYYHTDRLGSPVAITDRHGEPIARYAWDAYGRAMAGIFEPYNSVGFTGHLYDQATGLTYFGARWYDAETGKFLSRDPIQDGWNWYAYVGGDPVNFVDLWGLEATEDTGTGETYPPDVSGPTWPTESRRVTQGFNPPLHQGIDIGAMTPGIVGDDITASMSGTVTVAGHPEWSRSGSSYIIIDGDDDREYRYVHPDEILVESGDRVRQGDVIGTMGDDNFPGQVHLHFEIREDGVPQNPLDLLPKR